MTMEATNLHIQVQIRWRELAAAAYGITPTEIPVEPRPSEIRALDDDFRVLIRHVDKLIEAYGHYLRIHAPYSIADKLFNDVFVGVLEGALDGNALYEIQCAADTLREQLLEAAE